MCRQLVGCDDAFTWLCVFRHTQFHEGDQTAKILVTGAGAHEDGDRAEALTIRFLNAYLGADVCFDSVLFGGEVKARRAIHAVAIEQGHCRHFHRQGGGDQLLRHGGAFEKAECRPRM